MTCSIRLRISNVFAAVKPLLKAILTVITFIITTLISTLGLYVGVLQLQLPTVNSYNTSTQDVQTINAMVEEAKTEAGDGEGPDRLRPNCQYRVGEDCMPGLYRITSTSSDKNQVPTYELNGKSIEVSNGGDKVYLSKGDKLSLGKYCVARRVIYDFN